MGFYEHRAAKIIAEFDDARAEKMKKNQTSITPIFFNFAKKKEKNVNNRQTK